MILYNPIKNTLSNTVKTIKVGYRESQILSILLEHSPDVVKKQIIIQRAWESEYIGETSLAKSISTLRQTFIKLDIKESPIITVPKVGYRLTGNIIIDKKEAIISPKAQAKESNNLVNLKLGYNLHLIKLLKSYKIQ